MTILHVSNFNLLRLKGCFQNGLPLKISSGLIMSGHHVINYPERDLCRFFGFGHKNFWGLKKLNEHLINYAKVVEPTVMVLGHASTIFPQTLAEIKKALPNMKILMWNCDPIIPNSFKDSNTNVAELHSKADFCDLIAITTADKKLLSQFKRPNNQVIFMPNLADIAIETGRNFEHEELPYDMMYSATSLVRPFCGKDVNIFEIIDDVKKEMPDFKWLLGGFDKYPALHGNEYLKAFTKASMGFSLNRANDVYLYASDRMTHMMGNGQLTFMDRRTGFQDIFSDDEIAFYEEKGDFLDKLKFYHNNPKARMKVAKNGYEKIHKEFNHKEVCEYMMNKLFDKTIKNKKDWYSEI